jgi:citrate lyase subunit beta/citryl-CoA lyase
MTAPSAQSGGTVVPRRSLHFVPGDNPALIGKAITLPADGLIFDLEDAVVPARKPFARDLVRDTLAATQGRRFERWVRVNGPDTSLLADDVAATMPGQPNGYLIPKVRTPADILAVCDRLAAAEVTLSRPPGSTLLIPMVTETASGLLDMRDIAAASPRVAGIAWGSEDLAAAMGLGAIRDAAGRYLPVPAHARTMCAIVAAALGIDALDAVFTAVTDEKRFREECHEAVQMSFSGKLSIHPRQLAIINEVFTPAAETVAAARELVAAFDRNTAEGVGVFVWNGNMVDVPHLMHARKVLARAALTDASAQRHPA